MKHPIYLALDMPTWLEAKQFLKGHQLEGVPVKVGMELFYREGPVVIEKLKENNHPIFLDLKLHDIPTTVKRAMQNIAKLDVAIVNVHALGGGEMIESAKEGLLAGGAQDTQLFAVTILTSMDQTIWENQLQMKSYLQQTAMHLAKESSICGADGVVCSVDEVQLIKETCGENFLTMTPGIRLKQTNVDDQKRVATPKFAKQMGTDKLVVGRTVTQAKRPREAYQQVIKEWS